MSESKQFMKNTIMTLSRQLSAILIGLLYMIIIARALGPEGNGSYQLIILLPTLLLTILNFGIGSSSVYYIGKKLYPINTIVKTNMYAAFVFSGISVIAGAIYLTYFPNQSFSGVPSIYLYTILIVLPFLFLNEYFLVIFQGVQDFKAYNTLALSRQIVALISLVIFLFIFGMNLNGAVYSFILGIFSQFLLSLYYLKKRLNVKISQGEVSRAYFSQSVGFGIKAHMSNMLSFVNYRADIFIIGFYINPYAVGIYSAAVTVAERLWVVSQAISAVLFPRVSSMDSEDGKNQLTSIISRNVLFFSIVGGIIFYLVSDLMVSILYGNSYMDSSVVLKLLLPGIILFSVDRILSNDLAGRGKPEINMNVSLFTVVSNILLNIMLIPEYGINGAAFATSFTYSLSSIIKVLIFYKETRTSVYKLLIIQKEDLRYYQNLWNKIKRRKKTA